MGSIRNKRSGGGGAAAVAAGSSARATLSGSVEANALAAPDVLDQGRVFSEAVRRTKPLAAPGTRGTGQVAGAVQVDTARSRGLRPETARRLVTEGRDLARPLFGASPDGGAKEAAACVSWKRNDQAGKLVKWERRR